jgi:uncharacterized membrane protein
MKQQPSKLKITIAWISFIIISILTFVLASIIAIAILWILFISIVAFSFPKKKEVKTKHGKKKSR